MSDNFQRRRSFDGSPSSQLDANVPYQVLDTPLQDKVSMVLNTTNCMSPTLKENSLSSLQINDSSEKQFLIQRKSTSDNKQKNLTVHSANSKGSSSKKIAELSRQLDATPVHAFTLPTRDPASSQLRISQSYAGTAPSQMQTVSESIEKFGPFSAESLDKYLRQMEHGLKEAQPIEAQLRICQAILQEIKARKSKDFTDEHFDVLESELLSQSNMVIMIFKFFLQSKEYKFFVRRLKNVADTRSVLTAEKRLETKISELEEAKPSGPLAKSVQESYTPLLSTQASFNTNHTDALVSGAGQTFYAFQEKSQSCSSVNLEKFMSTATQIQERFEKGPELSYKTPPTRKDEPDQTKENSIFTLQAKPLTTTVSQVAQNTKGKKDRTKKSRCILKQKEAFTLVPQNCTQTQREPQVYEAPSDPITWQFAIQCLEDLGINMSKLKTEDQHRSEVTKTEPPAFSNASPQIEFYAQKVQVQTVAEQYPVSGFKEQVAKPAIENGLWQLIDLKYLLNLVLMKAMTHGAERRLTSFDQEFWVKNIQLALLVCSERGGAKLVADSSEQIAASVVQAALNSTDSTKLQFDSIAAILASKQCAPLESVESVVFTCISTFVQIHNANNFPVQTVQESFKVFILTLLRFLKRQNPLVHQTQQIVEDCVLKVLDSNRKVFGEVNINAIFEVKSSVRSELPKTDFYGMRSFSSDCQDQNAMQTPLGLKKAESSKVPERSNTSENTVKGILKPSSKQFSSQKKRSIQFKQGLLDSQSRASKALRDSYSKEADRVGRNTFTYGQPSYSYEPLSYSQQSYSRFSGSAQAGYAAPQIQSISSGRMEELHGVRRNLQTEYARLSLPSQNDDKIPNRNMHVHQDFVPQQNNFVSEAFDSQYRGYAYEVPTTPFEGYYKQARSQTFTAARSKDDVSRDSGKTQSYQDVYKIFSEKVKGTIDHINSSLTMDNNRRAVMKDFLDQQRDYYQPQTLTALVDVDYDRREQSFSLADQEERDRRTRYDFAHEKFAGK